MAYRKNVTDKQQTDVERAADDSADRFQWFDGKALQTGETKAVRAYDLEAQGNPGSTSSSAKRQISGSGAVVGSHNDKPYVFETPGRGGPPSPTPPIPPSVGKLYRVDFSQFATPGEQMFDGVGHQADAVPLAPGPCNNNWDEVTALADANFGSDGVNTWNLCDQAAAGNYPLVDSLGGSGAASIDLPLAGGGSGNDQGGLTTNYLRWGYLNYTAADAPFVIHLGAAAAGKTVKLAWYILGAAQLFTSAVTIAGATPATVQLDWGAANVVFQTAVADGSGDVSGVFVSSLGTNTNNDCPVAGLQIYQAP